jgi:hypothetical protein
MTNRTSFDPLVLATLVIGVVAVAILATVI